MSNEQTVPVEHTTSAGFRVFPAQELFANADGSGTTITFITKYLDPAGKMVFEKQIAVFFSEYIIDQTIAVLEKQKEIIEEIRTKLAGTPLAKQYDAPKKKRTGNGPQYQ